MLERYSLGGIVLSIGVRLADVVDAVAGGIFFDADALGPPSLVTHALKNSSSRFQFYFLL